MSAAVAAVTLALLAGLVVAGPAGAEVRLRRLRPARGPGQLRLPVPVWTPRAVAAAAMVALLAGHGVPALALVAVAVASRGPGARRTRAETRVRARLTRDLPRAADLLATCLEAGAEPASALAEVAAAIGGPLEARLRPVALALAAGSPATRAGVGSGGPDDPVGRLVRTLVRAGETGAPLASSVRDLAADERERARWDALERARRAGVRAVGPLAACFLPAFVLVGVLPVVVGVARSLLAGWA